MKPEVYFTDRISPEMVLELYKMTGRKLDGRVAIKLHSGEEGNQNFLKPEFFKPVIEFVGGTVVECNTAYEGSRNTTQRHLETLDKHGWSKCFKVDLLDGEGPDLKLDIPGGKAIRKNFVGKNIVNYDSMLVLSHFKGHPMGGYGGALKQLSIGVASSYGKGYIHGVYINVMKNMSVDCDCCAVAEDPCMKDIGILASLDPVAIDQACLDLVYASEDPGRDHLLERIESKNGVHTIEAAAALGIGVREYELIKV